MDCKNLVPLLTTCCLAFLLVLSNAPRLSAQDKEIELAEEYFSQQEYEKAGILYEKLARNQRNLLTIYKNYLQTLIALQNFKEAEKLVNRQIKQFPQNPTYRIDFGYLQQMQGKANLARKTYEELLKDFEKPAESAVLAAEHFLKLEENEWALEMMLAARKASRNKTSFALELAEIHGLSGNENAMIEEYLNYVLNDRSHLEYVKGALQDRISQPESFDNLERILLERLQKDANEAIYNELLLWLYLQQKRFYRAFIQAKALDKRYRLEGNELLSIGLISMKNEDYSSAQKIFQYIIDTYPNGSNYPVARNYYIKAKEEVVKSTFPVQEEDIRSLIGDYENLIDELGRNYKTFEAFRNIALLYAFYLDRKDTAVAILDEAVEISRGRTDFIAQCKTDLGDIYLLKDEPWESTLLYSQVEKLKKEHPLGYEAKLRNAKLSYYKGEFELAQEHLDILKEATSREIANDAMSLSLLIQDNLAFDTTGAALRDYSQVELLMFQHQDLKALEKLNQMLVDYTSHSLVDEVLWSKANLLLKIGKAEEAVEILSKIVADYADDIWGDDAYFLMGKIYEEDLNDKDRAMDIYKNILVKYPGSIYTQEARKRFRVLRGDFVN